MKANSALRLKWLPKRPTPERASVAMSSVGSRHPNNLYRIERQEANGFPVWVLKVRREGNHEWEWLGLYHQLSLAQNAANYDLDGKMRRVETSEHQSQRESAQEVSSHDEIRVREDIQGESK